MVNQKEYKMLGHPKVKFKRSEHGGWESFFDGNWHFTMRTDEEIEAYCGVILSNEERQPDTFDDEIWGGTIDEPIPDDLLDYLNSFVP